MSKPQIEYDHFNSTIIGRKSGAGWRWLVFVICVLAFFATLAPDRPIRAIQVLFGLDVIEVVGGNGKVR